MKRDPHLANGLNVSGGKIRHQAVAEALDLPYEAAETLARSRLAQRFDPLLDQRPPARVRRSASPEPCRHSVDGALAVARPSQRQAVEERRRRIPGLQAPSPAGRQARRAG